MGEQLKNCTVKGIAPNKQTAYMQHTFECNNNVKKLTKITSHVKTIIKQLIKIFTERLCVTRTQ